MPRVLEMAERLNVQFYSSSALLARQETLDNGNTLLRDIKIFRTGTFKDSMGIQHTWEPEHLEQMVFHYNLLKDRNILPAPPVRDGHKELFGGGGDVVGWVVDLQTQDGFLLADFEITEPEALGKIERGTFRARSSEVGYYETNDEAMYWPVLMGVAFVDIGAVEGLFKRENTSTRKFSLLTEEETPVSGENSNQNNGGNGAPPASGQQGTPPASPPNPAGNQQPPAAQHNQQQAGGDGQGGGQGQPPPVQQQQQHTQPPTPVQPSGNTTANGGTANGSMSGGNFTFSLNGAPTTDFGAVQQHITALETAAREQADAARREFVNGLARDNRIAATQVESLTAHALSLSDEQYKTFRASFEAAPTVGLLGQHGGGTVTNPNGEGDPQAAEVATLEEIVANHRRAGMKDEQIKKTNSYQRLQELKTANKQ